MTSPADREGKDLNQTGCSDTPAWCLSPSEPPQPPVNEASMARDNDEESCVSEVTTFPISRLFQGPLYPPTGSFHEDQPNHKDEEAADTDSLGPQLRAVAKKVNNAAEAAKDEDDDDGGLEDRLKDVHTYCGTAKKRKKGRNRGKFEAATCFAYTKMGWFGIAPDDEKRVR